MLCQDNWDEAVTTGTERKGLFGEVMLQGKLSTWGGPVAGKAAGHIWGSTEQGRHNGDWGLDD